MKLQISIFTLLVMAMFYGIAAVVLLLLWRLLRDWTKKWIVLAPLAVVLIALPWADEVWIAWHFAKACETAGVHVVRKVEAEGFYDSTMRSGYELINRYGYTFMEQPEITNRTKIEHLEKLGGKWRKTVLNQATARYVYKFTDPRQEIPISRQLEKFETVIVDSQTGEVLGRDTSFKRFPSWINSWVGFFGSGLTICKGPLDEPDKQKRSGLLYDYVLIPTNKQ